MHLHCVPADIAVGIVQHNGVVLYLIAVINRPLSCRTQDLPLLISRDRRPQRVQVIRLRLCRRQYFRNRDRHMRVVPPEIAILYQIRTLLLETRLRNRPHRVNRLLQL